ncbi:MAG: response regulator [Alcanivoracaceae bacterium]|jgi:two-component system chemotaxis response regulator CheB|nr:response regulator [Alcanivoracaceae bacterium]
MTTSTPDGDNIKVLIVDDSFLMRRVIRNIVEKDEGFVVLGEAANGVEALEQIAQHQPDVILLDIEMPKMDGIEFLKHAALATTARIVVISSVAQLGSPQAMEALSLGATDIVPKPSGVLSMDLEERKSSELLGVIRKAVA